MSLWPLSVRFAVRELRAGVRGFGVFLACLALGVAAIAATGSTAEAFRRGLEAQSRQILGGDLAVSADRPFTQAEITLLRTLGHATLTASARAMAETSAGERRMVELRGADAAYPLAGQVDTADREGRTVALADVFKPYYGIPGVAVDPALLERLGLKIGDTFSISDHLFVIRAALNGEPDQLGRGFALGPRVLTSLTAFKTAGFMIAPGFDGQAARIILPAGVRPQTAAATLKRQVPRAELHVRGREDAAAGARKLVDQLEYFLGFIGLASLVAGGLGVASAVGAYMESRTASIATLKALGAAGGLVRNLYLIQIGALAALGIAIGLVAGAAAPFALGVVAGKELPIPALFAVYPEPLWRAAAFGALAAAAFSLPPLARARATPPSGLYRREARLGLLIAPEVMAAFLAGAGLAGLSVLLAPSRTAAEVMVGGVIFAFVTLWLLGQLAVRLAGVLRAFTTGPLRMGLANLAGPRSAARAATPAIGLGLALLTAVALVQSSLLAAVNIAAPNATPALVFTEIPGARAAEFDQVIGEVLHHPGADRYQRWTFMTGRITQVKGASVDRAKIAPDQRWAFDRDMPMVTLDGQPANSETETGRWWPRGYSGPPLVALDADAARGAGLKVGDPITVSVLGRDIEAKVSVLRRVNRSSFGPGFTLVLNRSALTGAVLSSVAIAKADGAEEAAALRALGSAFPDVNVISVREQLEAARGVFDRLSLAVRGAAGVAALAGVLVLIGAIAAGARARAREAATLKVLGGSYAQILCAYVVEYGALGLIAGSAGALLGGAAAVAVVDLAFRIRMAADVPLLSGVIGGAMLLSALGGAAAALHAIARRPAPILRNGAA